MNEHTTKQLETAHQVLKEVLNNSGWTVTRWEIAEAMLTLENLIAESRN
tara:strand:- start:467 stop:613 length:147 start_codon:yes stop_codon:yes gene_type:complete